MAKTKDTPTTRRGGRQEPLPGTNLYRDTRTGVLWWRRTDPVTGRRVKRCTGTKVLEHALQAARELERLEVLRG